MDSSPESLRNVNLKLKSGKISEKPPVFDYQDDKPPVFSQGQPRPRTHIKSQFFSVSGREEPKFLFNALLLEIPSTGHLFKIENQFYEVRGVTRNMDFVGRDGNIAKEFGPDILVAPFIPKSERAYR
jgi:hypothetical protein